LLKNLQPLIVQGILSAVMSQSTVWYKFTDASEGQHQSIAIGHYITLQQSMLQEFQMTYNDILII